MLKKAIAVSSVLLSCVLAANAGELETKKTVAAAGMEFVWIPSGVFMMGSSIDESGRGDDERQHPVTLTKGFFMQITEVTQGQWKAIMAHNPSSFKNCGNECPVEQVSWDDVQGFIRKLNQREGEYTYRLPTEAEWEYAARAGSTTRFAFGDDADRLGEYAWNDSNSGDKTHAAGKKKPNAWGLYDMHGNAWEWCQDWYASKYPKRSSTDPTGRSSGSSRVIRGGGWCSMPEGVRSGRRSSFSSEKGYKSIGFRLVMIP